MISSTCHRRSSYRECHLMASMWTSARSVRTQGRRVRTDGGPSSGLLPAPPRTRCRYGGPRAWPVHGGPRRRASTCGPPRATSRLSRRWAGSQRRTCRSDHPPRCNRSRTRRCEVAQTFLQTLSKLVLTAHFGHDRGSRRDSAQRTIRHATGYRGRTVGVMVSEMRSSPRMTTTVTGWPIFAPISASA